MRNNAYKIVDGKLVEDLGKHERITPERIPEKQEINTGLDWLDHGRVRQCVFVNMVEVTFSCTKGGNFLSR
jgi:hypothetical protein